jgi:hypothetical protein
VWRCEGFPVASCSQVFAGGGIQRKVAFDPKLLECHEARLGKRGDRCHEADSKLVATQPDVQRAAQGRAEVGATPLVLHARVAHHPLQQRWQPRVARPLQSLPMQARQHVVRHPMPVCHERPGSGRIEQQRKHVQGLRHSGRFGNEPLEDAGRGLVAFENSIVGGQHRQGIGLLLQEHAVDSPVDFRRDGVQIGLGKAGRVARHAERLVLVPQRHAQRRHQPQHHVGARLRVARFEETDVARGDACRQRQVELRQPMAAAPVLQQCGEQALRHAETVAAELVAAMTCAGHCGQRRARLVSGASCAAAKGFSMNRKSFLTVAGAIALCVGMLALFLPAVLLESKGVPAHAAAEVWVREVGIALVSIALVALCVRGHPDSPTLKAFLLGNAMLQIGLFPIEIIAFANGTLSKLSGIVPNSLLHVGMAAAFVYYASRIRPASVAEHERGSSRRNAVDSGRPP